MQPALFGTSKQKSKVLCQLCPHFCLLNPGQYGKCGVRVNQDGELFTENYGILSAVSTDPVEKKPLYHFHPGRSILSIGSYGCNMSCDFCQNCEISQVEQGVTARLPFRDPEDIVQKATLHRENIGLAYTYNEPVIYFEYMLECAKLVREQGMKNVMVTNGFINRKPLEAILPLMDAFNVDLKAFTNKFYVRRTGSRLQPVLEAIRMIARSGTHLELTFLMIPGYNDQPQEWKEMIDWIADHCGENAILHVSRYFPRHKLQSSPTPLETIRDFVQIAGRRIRYVYPGNIPQLQSHTYCPACGNLLISRNLYHAEVKGIGSDGSCDRCDMKINGVFN